MLQYIQFLGGNLQKEKQIEYSRLMSVGLFQGLLSSSHLPSQVFSLSVLFEHPYIYFLSLLPCTLAASVPVSLINVWFWVSEHNLSMECIVESACGFRINVSLLALPEFYLSHHSTGLFYLQCTEQKTSKPSPRRKIYCTELLVHSLEDLMKLSVGFQVSIDLASDVSPILIRIDTNEKIVQSGG